MATVSKQYDIDYMNKICSICKKKANDGLYLDLGESKGQRIGRCKRCYRIKK